MKISTKVIFILTSIFIFYPLTSYTQNPGDLDATFGNGVIVITQVGNIQDHGRSLTIQSDGKIILCGEFSTGASMDLALGRYNIDGSLDETFGIGGIVKTHIGIHSFPWSVNLQTDGKIKVFRYRLDCIDIKNPRPFY